MSSPTRSTTRQRPSSRPRTEPGSSVPLSDQLERWLTGEGDRTLGSLVHAFGDKSFAILLVLLLGVPALPLPTGGVTHVFELIAAVRHFRRCGSVRGGY